MKRSISLVLVCLLVLAGTAEARTPTQQRHKPSVARVRFCPTGVPVQTITVVDLANVRQWVLTRVEQAVQRQINGPLRWAWRTPCVQFGVDGWPLYLDYALHRACVNMGAQGCNWQHGGEVATWGDCWCDGIAPQWSSVFDHELIEMLIPYQPVDPVEYDIYQADNGSMLSDFAYPSYFDGGSGPYDLLGDLHAPLG